MPELIVEEPTVLECIDGFGDCQGAVENRTPLSASGRSFPRCEKHWEARLRRQDELLRRYPEQPPHDWSPLDAGESWGSEDY
ncbi:hypothetical protein [Propionicimonas sp.]|uniref:hypothetical protein n=1 Tax=Propionicimonas sp. TaxID=1955623 RepID=UPI00182BDBD3|nr:hypothetical protein [Propionicimonas sp.]MBA3019689.1 hypothetical protein [Propionicimonas sp.]MBU4207966.1 hypothetical protein [Actinomycetota bacterium]MBU4411493.1 hypothetical protein [Actinomycetota bacterium]MCG2805807.1 hypothetical protein [Propionicimonas sp.]